MVYQDTPVPESDSFFSKIYVERMSSMFGASALTGSGSAVGSRASEASEIARQGGDIFNPQEYTTRYASGSLLGAAGMGSAIGPLMLASNSSRPMGQRIAGSAMAPIGSAIGLAASTTGLGASAANLGMNAGSVAVEASRAGLAASGAPVQSMFNRHTAARFAEEATAVARAAAIARRKEGRMGIGSSGITSGVEAIRRDLGRLEKRENRGFSILPTPLQSQTPTDRELGSLNKIAEEEEKEEAKAKANAAAAAKKRARTKSRASIRRRSRSRKFSRRR